MLGFLLPMLFGRKATSNKSADSDKLRRSTTVRPDTTALPARARLRRALPLQSHILSGIACGVFCKPARTSTSSLKGHLNKDTGRKTTFNHTVVIDGDDSLTLEDSTYHYVDFLTNELLGADFSIPIPTDIQFMVEAGSAQSVNCQPTGHATAAASKALPDNSAKSPIRQVHYASAVDSLDSAASSSSIADSNEHEISFIDVNDLSTLSELDLQQAEVEPLEGNSISIPLQPSADVPRLDTLESSDADLDSLAGSGTSDSLSSDGQASTLSFEYTLGVPFTIVLDGPELSAVPGPDDLPELTDGSTIDNSRTDISIATLSERNSTTNSDGDSIDSWDDSRVTFSSGLLSCNTDEEQNTSVEAERPVVDAYNKDVDSEDVSVEPLTSESDDFMVPDVEFSELSNQEPAVLPASTSDRSLLPPPEPAIESQATANVTSDVRVDTTYRLVNLEAMELVPPSSTVTRELEVSATTPEVGAPASRGLSRQERRAAARAAEKAARRNRRL